MKEAEAIVQRQLEAYNARDLERFVMQFSPTVAIYRPPATEPTLSGRAALAEHYARHRFNLPQLHAEIVNRMVFGNKVVDHERITGVRAEAFEAVAVYEIVDGLIQSVWFFDAD